MKRIIKASTSAITLDDVLDVLYEAGFDTHHWQTQRYAEAVVDYLAYAPADYTAQEWYQDTLRNYPEDLKDLPTDVYTYASKRSKGNRIRASKSGSRRTVGYPVEAARMLASPIKLN